MRIERVRTLSPRWANHGVLGAVFLVMLTSCAHRPEPKRTAPPINLSGYSQAFKDGFQDGCDTARGSPKVDEKRRAGDTQYAQGWRDGRSICAKR